MSGHLRDPVIKRLVNIIMKDGKKHAAISIVDKCFWILKNQMKVESPAEFTKRAIENAKPLVELKKYVMAGRTLQIPIPCRPDRQEGVALRFIRDAMRGRSENGSGLRLAKELVALEGRSGAAFQKRQDMHRTAEANRAYSHFLR